MRYYRRIIRISAEDSPNVRYAREQLKRGIQPDDKRIVPGLLGWSEYQKRLATWDVVRRTIGLDGKFYTGAQLLLFPPDWLDASARRWSGLKTKKRGPFALGIDPAEGDNSSAFAVVDLEGLVDLVSKKTPNTNVIPDTIVQLMGKYNIPPERVCIDAGGGRVHACRLQQTHKYEIRTIPFGAKVSLNIRRGIRPTSERREVKLLQAIFKNRRAQMYGELSEAMNPENPDGQFAIPEGAMGNREDPQSELRHQLAVMPKLYDQEQQLYMLPKNLKTEDRDPMNPYGDAQTLVGLIGHSPDEADALVLAWHALTHDDQKRAARAPGYGAREFMRA